MSDAAGTFDRVASRYDELRPVDESWWEVYDTIVRLGHFRGGRVLEVGCGTGRLSQALTDRALARVWAVDASPEMVARANELEVNARVGKAEALPFKQGWFDAVVMRMVAHLVYRPLAFEQAARVLAPGGHFVIATEDPASFEDVWFGKYFPSVTDLELSRFPSDLALRDELLNAGFEAIDIEPLAQERTMTREHALDVIRSRAYSTFDLLSPEEYTEGLRHAEADLPERFDYRFLWLFAVATR